MATVCACIFTDCGNHEHNVGHAEEDSHKHDGEIVLSQTQAKEAGIMTETTKAANFMTATLVSGQILSGQGNEQTIAATSAGIVKFADASIAEGTAVKAGQTIAVISAKNIQDGDPMAKAKATYEAAKAEYERAKELAGEKIISQKEFLLIKTQYETARISYEAQAKNSTPTGITAASPIGGYIKSLFVAQGEYVAVGQPIAVVTSCRRLQLRADVPSSLMQILPTVVSANFRMAGSDRVYSLTGMHGRLLSYGRSIADGSAFVPVTFEFDNIGDIVSGAYAEVWLLSKGQTPTISLPVEAITEEQGSKFVYIQTAADTYVKKEITTGASDGQRIEILKGLEEGEKVVCHGAVTVKLAATSKSIPGHSHNH